MKRPGRPLTLTKAVLLPRHPLSDRLRRVLKAVDAVHSPRNLKPVQVTLLRTTQGAHFFAYADTGPYEIEMNSAGTHPELSLLHEVAHFLEWQAIPKGVLGPRNFGDDSLFSRWLFVVSRTLTVQRLSALRDQQPEASTSFQEAAYALRPVELWARAYSQYVAREADVSVLYQQIAAENRAAAGTIVDGIYWPWDEFAPVQEAMQALFRHLEWLK